MAVTPKEDGIPESIEEPYKAHNGASLGFLAGYGRLRQGPKVVAAIQVLDEEPRPTQHYPLFAVSTA